MAYKSRILVVDDTPASLKLLSDLLRAEGYDVRSAVSGELALEAAASTRPDLILLDILMPGMDGFEVCRRLKANSRTCNVPILFISALSDTQEKLEGFELGAVDYVTKPYQREELLARVRTHLEIDRLRNHLEEMVKERNQQLAESEARLRESLRAEVLVNVQLRTLLNTIPDLVWLKNPDSLFLACNSQFERFLGAKEAEIIGKSDYDFVDEKMADFFRGNDLKAMSAGKVCANEEWLTFADTGYCGLFETLKTPMLDQDGKLIGILGIARDITERKAAEAKIQRHMQLYAALSQCNKAIVHCANEEELFLEVCRAAVQFGGMTMAWIGLFSPDKRRLCPVASFGTGTEELQNIDMSMDADSVFGQGPTSVAICEQRPYWCQDFINDPVMVPWKEHAARAGWAASASLPLHGEETVVGAFVLYAGTVDAFDDAARDLLMEMAEDIGFALENLRREVARKQAEAEIERLAFYDPLTHLPNRRLVYDRLQQAIATSARHGMHGAVLFIGLDNFKTLNDTKGHGIGDLLLIEVAKRLHDCVREEDSIARSGGDQFVVILSGLSDESSQAIAQAKTVGNKILAAIAEPYFLRDYEYHGSASMGISLFGEHDSTVEELFKYTDTALYEAKRGGRNSLMFYDPVMQAALENRSSLENDLRWSLEENQFTLFYQLQVNHKGEIIGAEVLIRWLHPQKGLVSPLDFIPLAEETGLIVPIGHWVLDAACGQLGIWEKDPQMSKLQLAVNVSASQFHQADFVKRVQDVLCHHQINPNRLKLELTESSVLDDINDTIVKMQQLRELGVRFSLDDFGTGYSSLSYLTRLPIDQLKIDQSFVRNIGVTQSDTVIVQTIIGMANNLMIESIAEGVETEDQRAFLERHGCNLYQGYFFGKPVPLEEFVVRFG